MKNSSIEIIFHVEQDEEGIYNARALGHSIFTFADTKEQLKANIREAVDCHFNEDDPKRPQVINIRFVDHEVIAV